MARKYIPVLTFCDAEHTLNRIKKAIQDENMTEVIPAVKFEIEPPGGFFYFLAVEGQCRDIFDVLQTMFSRRNVPGNIIRQLKTLNQIKSMVNPIELGSMKISKPTIIPNYKPKLQDYVDDLDDPIDMSQVSFSEPDTECNLHGEKFDRLLYWLSANAEGSWPTFKNVCSVLQLANDVNKTRSIFRRLKILGYIESSENGQKWSINPTVLVQCAADQEVYFLTGQQSPMLLDLLQEHYNVEPLPQWNYQGPSCVRINGTITNDTSLNGFEIVHAGTVSVQLADLLPDLEGWKALLPAINRLSTTTYSIEIWNGRKYIQCNDFYEKNNGRYVGASGLYRLAKKEENNLYQMVLYFDEPNQQWLRGDWYGLCFLANNSGGKQCKVKYNSNTKELIIPVEEHWPLLYEKSLVFASGMLPARDNKNKWLKYTNISNELAQVLAEKLYVTIEEI